MDDNTTVEWKITDHSTNSVATNQLKSTKNGISSNEEQDSKTESSSEEGEYECIETHEPAESLVETLKETRSSDESSGMLKGQKLGRILTVLPDSETESSSEEGEYECTETHEPAESLVETLKETRSSDESSETDSNSDDEDKLSLQRLASVLESLEKPLKKPNLADENVTQAKKETSEIAGQGIFVADKEDTDELPSRTLDKDFLFMPPDLEYFEEKEEWKSSGKWLVFSHGDLQKLDALWIGLRPLLATGTLIGLKCSTATDRLNGVIMCYTLNCEDKKAVKMAADAIRNINNDGYIRYYKTNAASDSGYYRMHGDKFITKYMHTNANSLYERDEHNRWKKVFLEENDII